MSGAIVIQMSAADGLDERDGSKVETSGKILDTFKSRTP